MLRQLFNHNWSVTEKTANFGMNNGEEVKTVNLPYDAMVACPRNPNSTSGNKKAFYPNKTWEYTKKFTVAAEDCHKHICLQFEGVYRQAMVYVNGDFAGQDSSGYSAFTIDIDRFLRYGEENEVTVVARTADDSRWYTGAGIYRDVYLLTSSLVHIAPNGVKIATADITPALATVEVTTTISNSSARALAPVRVETQVLDADGNVVAQDTAPVTVFRGESVAHKQRIYLKTPKLWDVDTPTLYTCKTRVVAQDGSLMDENTETFGVRSMSLDPFNGLCINGNSVKLRGACIHHDNGPIGTSTFYRAEERRIEILKQAGFNAIRMSHNPASPAMLRACDELGMLVMDEAFDMWTETKCNFDYAIDFPTWWERDIAAMVDKDYNHPCVIAYSIGNEIKDTGSPNGSAWGRKLADKIRALDGARYTINCINGMVAAQLLNVMRLKARENGQAAAAGTLEVKGEINTVMSILGAAQKDVMVLEEVTVQTAESFACVDIAGYNYMDSRYAMDKELFPNRVICGAETFPPDFDKNWRQVLDNGNVIGDFTWTGWDYLGEAGLGMVSYNPDPMSSAYGDYPTIMSMTGDIDITGHRRPVSYYREIVFGLRKAPYIAVQRPEHYGERPRMSTWSWSDSVASWSWNGFEGKPVVVEVYSDAEEVELLLDGKPIGRTKAGESERFRALFDTVYQRGELTAVAYQNGQEVGRHSIRTAEGAAKLTAQADRAETLGDGTDIAYIHIMITDEKGTVYTDKKTAVSVEVVGPASLIGFGSGEPAPTEEFYESTHSTYDGQALAIVRPTGVGTIKVNVTAEGIANTVSLAIQAV